MQQERRALRCCIVGAPDQSQHLAGKLAQLRADRVFMIPAEIVYDLFKVQRQVVRFFVNRQVLVLGRGDSPITIK